MVVELFSTPFFTDPNIQFYARLESNSNDSSPNTYNLTDTNTPTYVVGQFNNAVRYAVASSQYSSIADASSPNLRFSGSFSLVAWVSPNSNNINQAIMSKINNANQGYILYIGSDGKPVFTVTSGSGVQLASVQPNVILTVGTYRQLVGVYDATTKTATLYISGSAFTGTANPSMTTVDAPNVPFALGCSFQGGGDTANSFADADIDDAATFDRALTLAEVIQLFTGSSASASISPSPSASVSPSASQSPSASVSPSASISRSPSATQSPSSSFSASPSPSPSPSASVSPSASFSPSPSKSPSATPSFAPGTGLFSKMATLVLPTTKANLSTPYYEEDEENVETRDGIRVSVSTLDI